MATELKNLEKKQENLKKLLAAAVRSNRWTYSIFWSISSSEPGVLEWGEGYYNGDIKTRKTVQAMELDADRMGLQRSEQLRELYKYLLASQTNPQARRPSAALSPEDLSNTEWYYLVCMSFVFNLGEGLPGRSYINNQAIWLCNAPQAESRLFSRSLLAKSASIQTVVCFPYSGGVVELGVTDLVSEDPAVIQHVQASLLGIDSSIISQQSKSNAEQLNNDILEEYGLLESPSRSFNGFGLLQPTEQIIAGEGADEELMEDELSNFAHASMTSSDCISHNPMSPEILATNTKAEMVETFHHQEPKNENVTNYQLTRMETELQSAEDLHYQNVISSLFKTTHQLVSRPSVANTDTESCFVQWTRGGVIAYKEDHRKGNQRSMLKRILFEVPKMCNNCMVVSNGHGFEEDKIWMPQPDSHILAERRREKENERFSALKSLIPSVNKGDKVSILDDTISHLKELERRVKELEGIQVVDNSRLEITRTDELQNEVMEMTSNTDSSNQRIHAKRKACDLDYEKQVNRSSLISSQGCCSSDNDDVSISLCKEDVLIKILCPWKEGLFLQIVAALGNLQLDAHSIQSSNSNNMLSITIKAKVKGSSGLMLGKIRQAIQRVLKTR